MSLLLKDKENVKETNKAERIILFEDEKTMITLWRFPPGAETGWHKHKYDYVTLQQSEWKIKIRK